MKLSNVYPTNQYTYGIAYETGNENEIELCGVEFNRYDAAVEYAKGNAERFLYKRLYVVRLKFTELVSKIEYKYTTEVTKL